MQHTSQEKQEEYKPETNQELFNLQKRWGITQREEIKNKLWRSHSGRRIFIRQNYIRIN